MTCVREGDACERSYICAHGQNHIFTCFDRLDKAPNSPSVTLGVKVLPLVRFPGSTCLMSVSRLMPKTLRENGLTPSRRR